MTKNTRKHHTSEFKAKVALEAVRELETVPELSRRYGVHVNQIYKWKREFIAKAARAFGGAGGQSSKEQSAREGDLLKKIGELTIERDFLAKGLGRLG